MFLPKTSIARHSATVPWRPTKNTSQWLSYYDQSHCWFGLKKRILRSRKILSKRTVFTQQNNEGHLVLDATGLEMLDSVLLPSLENFDCYHELNHMNLKRNNTIQIFVDVSSRNPTSKATKMRCFQFQLYCYAIHRSFDVLFSFTQESNLYSKRDQSDEQQQCSSGTRARITEPNFRIFFDYHHKTLLIGS